MALTLIATAGATNANAYCTFASALINVEQNIHIYATFASLSTANAEACIIYATTLLDTDIAWVGTKATETQALRWPRKGVYDPDGYAVTETLIPEFLQEATSFYAYFLSQSDRIADSDTYGFKKLKAGSLFMEIDKYDRRPVMPNPVWNMLEFYGTKISSKTRTLVRI